MTAIYDALTNLTAEIRGRGIAATMDPRNLRLPGALVDLDTIGPDNSLCGDVTATARVTLVVGDHGHPRAIARLTEMFMQITDMTTGAEPASFTLPDQGTVPALSCYPIPLELED